MKILAILTYPYHLKLVVGLLEKIKEDKNNLLSLYVPFDISCNKNIADFLSGFNLISSFELILNSEFDIVLTTHIWQGEFKRLFESYVEKNIPILLLEHGSLLVKNLYLKSGNETFGMQRGDINLCSHATCWGEHGKECWLGYGVDGKKLFITGAPHLDLFYSNSFDKDSVRNILGVGSKKIIVMFTYFNHWDRNCIERNIAVLSEIEEFVKKNDEYALVVKPHPNEFMKGRKAEYDYAKETILVSDIYEDGADGVVKVDVDSLLYASDIFVAFETSAVIPLFIMNKKIIYVEYRRNVSAYFKEKFKDFIFPLSMGDSFEKFLAYVESSPAKDCSYAASILNYGNDGKASERVLELIGRIIDDKRRGVKFYGDRREVLVNSLTDKYPYPWRNYMRFLLDKREYGEAENVLKEYMRFFSEPNPFLGMIALGYLERGDFEKAFSLLKDFYEKGKLGVKEKILYGRLLNSRGEYRDAAELLRPSCYGELPDEDKVLCNYELGFALIGEGKFDEAVEVLEDIFSVREFGRYIAPQRAYFKIGEALSGAGDAEGARKYLVKCLELVPNHNKAKEVLNRLGGAGKQGSGIGRILNDEF